LQAEAGGQRFVALAVDRKVADVDRVGNHRDLLRRDAAPDDVKAQAFADGGGGVDPLERVRFHRAGDAVAQPPFAGGAVVDRGVFPEGADFVDHRDAEPLADPQRGDRVQGRRVRVQHVRPDLARHFQQSRGEAVDDGQLVEQRQAVEQPRGGRGAVEAEAVDLFMRLWRRPLLGAGQVERFPAERALLLQDRAGAEGVAAVQRNRMVEHVQHAQRRAQGIRGRQRAHAVSPCSSLRRNASNISTVQIGAL
jgi:hypothetical protein